MSNNVINVVKLVGPADVIQELKCLLYASVAKLNRYGDVRIHKYAFSLNKLIPRPKALEEQNLRSVPEEILDMVKANPEIQPTQAIPEHMIMDAKQSLVNIEAFGFANKFAWSWANWGTPWEVAYSTLIGESEQSLVYQFETVSSWPERIFQAMVKRFPMVEITWEILNECDRGGAMGERWKTFKVEAVTSNETDPGQRPVKIFETEHPLCYA